MRATKKAKRNLIIIFSVSVLVALVLIAVIIWQTVKVGRLNGEIKNLDVNNSKQEELIEKQNQQIEYYESENFKEDYIKYEMGYTTGESDLYK